MKNGKVKNKGKEMKGKEERNVDMQGTPKMEIKLEDRY